MTKLKICGIKESSTLQLLHELAVDYVGFVFAPSKRQVTAQEVKAMLTQVSGYPYPVGVMVNPTLGEIESIMQQVPLHAVQLHGQETPDFCEQVRRRFGVEVWKAISVREEATDEFSEIKKYTPYVQSVLFDTHDPKVAGGTGRRFSWEQIPQLQRETGDTPYFIAGGINLENVRELLQGYHPFGVDISSGVETDGKKDETKIRQFVERVRENDQHNVRLSNVSR